jgi:hypothetical protein
MYLGDRDETYDGTIAITSARGADDSECLAGVDDEVNIGYNWVVADDKREVVRP